MRQNFWRDQSGNEIDYRKQIDKWLELKNKQARQGAVIYCGSHITQQESPVPAPPWYIL